MARRRVMMHIALLMTMMLLFGVVTLAMMLVAVAIAIAMAMVMTVMLNRKTLEVVRAKSQQLLTK